MMPTVSTFRRSSLILAIALAPVVLAAQGGPLDPAQLLKPLAASWPTHSGDYTSRRYSALAHVNRATVSSLSLAWVSVAWVVVLLALAIWLHARYDRVVSDLL